MVSQVQAGVQLPDQLMVSQVQAGVQLPDQLMVLNPKQLQDLIHSSIQSSLFALFPSKEQNPPEPAKRIYRTRKYVKDFFHTTYPTLQKHTDAGLLKSEYFGRRVLYDDAQLRLDTPKFQAILKKRKKKPPAE